jgi:hypothetical protein
VAHHISMKISSQALNQLTRNGHLVRVVSTQDDVGNDRKRVDYSKSWMAERHVKLIDLDTALVDFIDIRQRTYYMMSPYHRPTMFPIDQGVIYRTQHLSSVIKTTYWFGNKQLAMQFELRLAEIAHVARMVGAWAGEALQGSRGYEKGTG